MIFPLPPAAGLQPNLLQRYLTEFTRVFTEFFTNGKNRIEAKEGYISIPLLLFMLMVGCNTT